MTPFFHDATATIFNSDCLLALQSLGDNSIDSIVTDPPYGLAFMGKRWDYDVPSVEIWTECLRVLKPGGHLLAFAGTRTQHRMAVRIEDAGFEIRDMIAWVYGSGFPKSLDVSKAIDKAAGVERESSGQKVYAGGHVQNHAGGKQGYNTWKAKGVYCGSVPASESAKQWDGWGTALKPSLEPITVARKPLAGTVAANVLQHGTGGLNIDGCRIPTDSVRPLVVSDRRDGNGVYRDGLQGSRAVSGGTEEGRWPANLIHDGSEEVVGRFPETTSGSLTGQPRTENKIYGSAANTLGTPRFHNGDSGSAARFFYAAKADASERRDSKHPTVKPISLMRYLVRLVTPIGATVLDPFMGSGTTIEAARLESCKAIGMERESEYCCDAVKRLSQGVLF
jgi:DNA modification methylase